MTYKNIERKIAKTLEAYPTIRRLLKFIYQRLSYLIYRKYGNCIHLDSEISIKGILGYRENDFEAFFGYYDKSPWSFDGKYYLIHVYDPNHKDKVKIGIYDCENDELNIIDEVLAFNFQQGAMLGWLDRNSYQYVYNSVEDMNLVTKVRDAISGKEIKTIPMPIQSINAEGTEALTLNYKRLNIMIPEYGYNVDVKNFSPCMNYYEDGIWKIDLNTGKTELILSLADLISNKHNKTMNKSKHKINHIEYCPSGKRFVFMHRWISLYGKFSRLYTAKSDASDIHCLADDRMVSHYSWLDDEHLIAWARKESIGDKYFLFRDKNSEFKIIGDNILDIYGDGHPHVSPDGEWIVTDTYPNKARIRKLILFNLKLEKKIIVGNFFSPLKYDGYYRCDLHPRWSPDGAKISIDSAHEGFRNSYIIDISSIITK